MPGDRVGYVWSADAVTPAAGVVRYVGPVKGLGEDGHWFGVELLEVSGSPQQGRPRSKKLLCFALLEREGLQLSEFLLST